MHTTEELVSICVQNVSDEAFKELRNMAISAAFSLYEIKIKLPALVSTYAKTYVELYG